MKGKPGGSCFFLYVNCKFYSLILPIHRPDVPGCRLYFTLRDRFLIFVLKLDDRLTTDELN